jgi:hypothetical protein
MEIDADAVAIRGKDQCIEVRNGESSGRDWS